MQTQDCETPAYSIGHPLFLYIIMLSAAYLCSQQGHTLLGTICQVCLSIAYCVYSIRCRLSKSDFLLCLGASLPQMRLMPAPGRV